MGKRGATSRLLALALGYGLLTLIWTGFAWRIMSFAENYIGVDPQLAVWPLVVVGILALALVALRRSDRMATGMLAMVLLSILALFLVQEYHVLLHYERWLDIGMPERPF